MLHVAQCIGASLTILSLRFRLHLPHPKTEGGLDKWCPQRDGDRHLLQSPDCKPDCIALHVIVSMYPDRYGQVLSMLPMVWWCILHASGLMSCDATDPWMPLITINKQNLCRCLIACLKLLHDSCADSASAVSHYML